MSGFFPGDEWDADMLDSVPEIAAALDVPRSEARKLVVECRVRGECSRCGEARFSDYSCRHGGATVWKAEP